MANREMGEFEARPELKPAVEVPIERRRPTGLITLVIVLLLVIVGLVAYIVYDKVNSGSSKPKNTSVEPVSEQSDGSVESKKLVRLKVTQ